MGYFARINQKRIVTQVIVAEEEYIETLPGTWIETSATGEFRKNYAGIGYTYDYMRDAFISPKPKFESWVLNENTCKWEAPVPHPNDGNIWVWDEDNLQWNKI